MLPYIIVFIFSLGILFHKEALCNFARKVSKRVRENIDFYGVLYPIIWNKKSRNSNSGFILCLCLVFLEIILSKLLLFIDKDITDSFTNFTEGIKENVPWGFLVLKSTMEMVKRSVLIVKRQQYNKIGKDITDRLQIEAFAKIHAMPLKWNIEKGIGEINSFLQSGCQVLWTIIQNGLSFIIPQAMDVIFSFYYVSTRYSFMMAIIILLCSIVNPIAMDLFRKWSKPMREKQTKAEEETFGHSMDSLTNFQTVKYFTCEDNERSMFRKLKEEHKNSGNDLKNWTEFLTGCLSSLSNVFSLGVTLFGANQLSKNEISYGEYLLLSRLFFELYRSIYELYFDWNNLLNKFEVLGKTVSLLNETPEIIDKNNAMDIHLNHGKIEFKNVTFTYDLKKDIFVDDKTKNNFDINDILEKDIMMRKTLLLLTMKGNDDEKDTFADLVDIEKSPAIDGVSFVVEAGECLALVGPSGSGKSTIAKLLMRMYDIQEGEISIDNQDISEVTMKSLRSNIGVVPQAVELFNDKIMDNIKYGRPDATEEQVHEAALKAEIHEKIMSMDEKYETEVGNRGLKLSGGERQRVGIARVFLKDPKIVIFDEATSALDSITEKKIQSSLERTYKGRTSVIIAHRLSTVCKADNILVMDKGKVVERGSHEELINLGGLYENMWNQQNQK